ncbi:osmoprotectant transport system permease protein [Tistlia consotensis]|uniref:Osmoprotectant transport system permease protein n=1 Tax=Tistlia consotensis USBA 355 TaxID=560819 RepID=A0A1Y6B7U2_9PROT|nr:ABC transporter permease [Tistlia consotensis]SME88831.1 osmoprotectant transport system permease protein [Tistlia consotensis USBA 355]SNR25373.1 osmoprotectant transport system permease protein [Tistlia consotensis]
METLVAFLLDNRDLVGRLLGEHLTLTLSGTGLGFAIAFPMAVAASRTPRLGRILSVVANLGQTVPSFAVLGLAIPLLGIGFAPALLALTLRALLPIYLNAYVGLRDLPPALLEASRGIGMTPWQSLAWVELPLALPATLGGLRTAAVESVGIATLAAFIGGGGLGDLILQGIALRDTTRLLAGAVPAAALAILIELLLGAGQAALTRAVGVARS